MLLLVDLDGVVYRGREPIPGVPELLTRLADGGDTIIYCTNNSRSHRTDYLEHLALIGAPVTLERIHTSARATALTLSSDTPPRVAMVFGGPGLARELEEVGIAVVGPTREGLDAGPDALVVGMDFDLSHDRLSMAMRAVLAGARFVATNRDRIYPSADGWLAGAGSIVGALEAAAGRPPDLVVGKPEPILFETAAATVGMTAAKAVVIGDALLSDIAGAHAVGARSVLILTGVSTEADLDATPPDRWPTVVARDTVELERAIESLRVD
jgi:HAD superfamily hydrolase (TIGR01450 family)